MKQGEGDEEVLEVGGWRRGSSALALSQFVPEYIVQITPCSHSLALFQSTLHSFLC